MKPKEPKQRSQARTQESWLKLRRCDWENAPPQRQELNQKKGPLLLYPDFSAKGSRDRAPGGAAAGHAAISIQFHVCRATRIGDSIVGLIEKFGAGVTLNSSDSFGIRPLPPGPSKKKPRRGSGSHAL